MSEIKHKVVQGETLWSIARSYDLTPSAVIRIERVDGTIDRRQPDGSIPNAGILAIGDVVVLACSDCAVEANEIIAGTVTPPEMQSEEGQALEETSNNQPNSGVDEGWPCAAPIILLDPGHGGDVDLRVFNTYASATDVTRANNAIGCVSNVLEKDLTQAYCDALKIRIDSDERYADDYGAAAEVHLTKHSSDIGMPNFERALLAQELRADFMLILHFNASADANRGHHRLGNSRQPAYMDVTPVASTGTVPSEQSASGYPREFFGQVKPPRGPELVVSNHTNPSMPADINAKVTLAGQLMVNLAYNAVFEWDSFYSVDDYPQRSTKTKGTGSLNPRNFFLVDSDSNEIEFEGKKKIVPIFLEVDFLNSESGDRYINSTEYQARYGDFLQELGLENREGDFHNETSQEVKERLVDYMSTALFLSTQRGHRFC